jgi:hypothetical protein
MIPEPYLAFFLPTSLPQRHFKMAILSKPLLPHPASSMAQQISTPPHFKMAIPSKPLPPRHTPIMAPEHQDDSPSYNLSIQPLLDLQRQIQHPFFPNAHPSPTVIHLHREYLYTRLHAQYLTIKNHTLSTFYSRLRCPRCGQLPVRDHAYHFTSMLDMNHALPKEGLVLWRTLRREMEGVDLLRLRQGHLDRVVGGLREVERLFLECDQGGCGVEAWNGGRAGPPFG